MQKRDLKEDIGFHHDKDEAMASLKQVQGFRGGELLAGQQWQSLIVCPCSGTVREGRGGGRIQCTETCVLILFARQCCADQAPLPTDDEIPGSIHGDISHRPGSADCYFQPDYTRR